MKHLKRVGSALTVAAALALFSAGSASATTLEVGGKAKTESVNLTATLKSGTSAITRDTSGLAANTCAASEVKGATSSPFTGTSVTGAVSTLTFSNCSREPVTKDAGGTLHFTWTSGTNGTVVSSGAEWTIGSPFGTLNCKTGAGTHLGTLTGVASGHATIDINSFLSCSGIWLKWEGTYTVTSPTGLGVVS